MLALALAVRSGALAWPAAAVLAAAGIWLAGMLASRLPVRVLERSVRRLRRIREGDLARPGSAPASDPLLASLQDSIEDLAAHIRAAWEDSDRRIGEIESIVDDLADAVIAVDRQGRVTRANPAAGQFFGHLPHQGMLGRTVLEATLNHSFDGIVSSCLQHRAQTAGVLELYEPKQRSVSVSAIPRVTASGEPAGAVAVLHDISELTRVDRIQREFAANASHELRTPIAGVKVMAEGLLNGALEDPEMGPRFAASIVDSADRLARLVDDLLFMNVRGSGSAAEREIVDVSRVASSVCDKLACQAAGRGIRLESDIASVPPVAADEHDLWRAIANLVDNAIRYTDSGGAVKLSVQSAENTVEIAVADTGIGIAAEHREKVFERFFRVDVARSRESGGTGLGLPIVRQVVSSLGGTVTVESEIGKGSRFTIRLPAAAPERTEDAGGSGRTDAADQAAAPETDFSQES